MGSLSRSTSTGTEKGLSSVSKEGFSWGFGFSCVVEDLQRSKMVRFIGARERSWERKGGPVKTYSTVKFVHNSSTSKLAVRFSYESSRCFGSQYSIALRSLCTFRLVLILFIIVAIVK